MLASYVALSRVLDGRHFPYQTNAGIVLGLVCIACMMKSELMLVEVPLGSTSSYSENKKNKQGDTEKGLEME